MRTGRGGAMDHIDPARPIAAGWAARLVETNANQPPTMLEPELPKTSRPCRPTSGRSQSQQLRRRPGRRSGEASGWLPWWRSRWPPGGPARHGPHQVRHQPLRRHARAGPPDRRVPLLDHARRGRRRATAVRGRGHLRARPQAHRREEAGVCQREHHGPAAAPGRPTSAPRTRGRAACRQRHLFGFATIRAY